MVLDSSDPRRRLSFLLVAASACRSSILTTFNDFSDEVIIDDAENVVFNNHLQVQNAERFIFSYDDDFRLARRMISRRPGLTQ